MARRRTNPDEGATYGALKERAQEINDSRDSITSLEGLKKQRTEWRDIKKEVEEKAKPPTHAEIMGAHEKGTLAEKLEINRTLVNKALEQAGVLRLHDAVQISAGAGGGIDLNRFGIAEEGKPQVFATPVKQRIKKGLFRREKVVTSPDEAFVVIRLNNQEEGEDKSKSTVIVATVKHDGGVPKVDAIHESTFAIMTEEEYTQKVFGRADPLEARWLRGEVTSNQFSEEFSKRRGYSLKEYWHQWDSLREADPQHEKARRAEAHVELRHRVEGRYVELFAEVRDNYEGVKKEVRDLQRESRKRRKEALLLLEGLDFKDSKKVALAKGVLIKHFGLTSDEIVDVMAKLVT